MWTKGMDAHVARDVAVAPTDMWSDLWPYQWLDSRPDVRP